MQSSYEAHYNSCHIATLFQVTEELLRKRNSKHLKSTNGVVAHLSDRQNYSLKYCHQMKDRCVFWPTLMLLLQHTYDQISQKEYAIFQLNEQKLCLSIQPSLYKPERSTKSFLGSEVMTFANSFDMLLTLRRGVECILRKYILLSIVSNIRSLSNVLTKATCSTKEGFVIGFQTVIRRANLLRSVTLLSFILSLISQVLL